MGSLFYSIIAIGVFLCFEAFAADRCMRPKVRKETIIRSKESIANGAKLLLVRDVERARDCYTACCNEETCDTAVMHYKRLYDSSEEKEEIRKQCYLFSCGEPSVCLFDQHDKYAVIELSSRGKNLSPIPLSDLTTNDKEVPENKPKDSHVHGTECPPGVPMPMCAEDLCEKNVCPAHPEATCKMNFCGGCFYDFFDASGKKVICAVEGTRYVMSTTAPKPSEQDLVSVKVHTSETNEQAVVVNPDDYGTPPKDALLETDLRKTAGRHSEAEHDPYFNTERRKWLDTRTEEPLLTTAGKSEKGKGYKELVKAKSKVPPLSTGTLLSVPLLVALFVCVILLIIVIYRLKCAKRGKPRKFQVDDGDYLINGMYL